MAHVDFQFDAKPHTANGISALVKIAVCVFGAVQEYAAMERRIEAYKTRF